jgi:hypothetical protein
MNMPNRPASLRNLSKFRYGKTFSVLLALMFFFLSIKGGDVLSTPLGSYSLEQYIVYNSFVLEFKNNSLVVAFGILVILSFLILRLKSVNGLLRLTPFFFLISLILFFLRLSFESSEHLTSLVLAISFNIFFYLYCALMTKKCDQVAYFVDCLVFGLVGFSFLFVWGNFLIGINGQGFSDGLPRFLGLTSHPNFLGVLSAHSVIILLVFLQRCDFNFYLKFLMLLTLLLGFGLVFYSASRTAILMTFVGILLTLISSAGGSLKKSIWLIRLIAGLFLGAIVLYIFSDFFESSLNFLDVLDRVINSGNTRDDIWSELMEHFYKNPIFGDGSLVESSENSLLKLIATAGFLPGIFFLLSIFGVIQYSLRVIFSKEKFNFSMSCIAVLAIVTILGAFFEGYLIERAGFGPVLFFIEAFVLSLIFDKRTSFLLFQQPSGNI